VLVPEPVDRVIKRVARQMAQPLPADDLRWMKCSELFSGTYRIPVSSILDLYVADVSYFLGVEWFRLILYDRHSKTATRDPPQIGAKWSQGFAQQEKAWRKRTVSFADLYGNGGREVVFRERVHNGTMYNGEVWNYFEVGSNLRLIRVLALEKEAGDPFPGNGWYEKALTRVAPGRVRLETFYVTDKAKRGRSMGYAILLSTGPGHPFHVAERHPNSKQVSPTISNNRDVLISFWATHGDDYFLSHGYVDYY